jgi:hypothetical protein
MVLEWNLGLKIRRSDDGCLLKRAGKERKERSAKTLIWKKARRRGER